MTSKEKPLIIRTHLILATAILFVPLFCSTGLAQNANPRPVARLVSSTEAVESSTIAPSTRSAGRAIVANPTLEDADSIERRAFEATNLVREKNGLRPLVWDPELSLVARNHSENMARLGFFGHNTPAGMRLRDRARAAGIRQWKVIAENIAYNKGFADPGGFAVERWMISPGHRANILDTSFRSSAIGSYVADDGRVYITQVFITRGAQ